MKHTTTPVSGIELAIVAEASIGQIEYASYLEEIASEDNPADAILVEKMFRQFNPEALEKTIAAFLERHESLRTIFPRIQGSIKQVILPVDERFSIEYFDVPIQELTYTELRQSLLKKISAVFSHIGEGPLIKFYYFKGRKEKGVLAIYIHHILSDEWSTWIIHNELDTLYESFAAGTPPLLPKVTAQLRDYCQRQNTWLTQNRETLIAFWKHRLDGYASAFDIERFYKTYNSKSPDSRPAEHISLRPFDREELYDLVKRNDGTIYHSILDGARYTDSRAMTAAEKWSHTGLIYASLYIALHIYTGKNNILLAALIADRFVPAYHRLIGCLLGGVYFPRYVQQNTTINDFIQAVSKDLLANSRKIIPSHDFLDLDGKILLTSCDMYVNYVRRKEQIPPHAHPVNLHYPTNELNYPLQCRIIEYIDGLVFEWRYNRSLFTTELFEDFAKHHIDILWKMLLHPSGTIHDLQGD